MRGMSAENPYRDLSRDEMWELLDSEPFGRLAVEAGGFVDIFPVNFVVRGKKLWFRTAPGSKLATLTVNDQVAFEVDRRDEQRLMVSSVVRDARVASRTRRSGSWPSRSSCARGSAASSPSSW